MIGQDVELKRLIDNLLSAQDQYGDKSSQEYEFLRDIARAELEGYITACLIKAQCSGVGIYKK